MYDSLAGSHLLTRTVAFVEADRRSATMAWGQKGRSII
jgi:hypothetical protein